MPLLLIDKPLKWSDSGILHVILAVHEAWYGFPFYHCHVLLSQPSAATSKRLLEYKKMIGDRQLAKLVKFFTDAPSSRYTPDDISITFGEARIKYDPLPDDYDATGFVDRAVYGKLMLDAATLAAGTLVEDRFVTNESFNLYAMKPFAEGKLIAIARLIHARLNRFTVEVRLIDEQGLAIASSHGTFAVTSMPAEPGDDGEPVDNDTEEDHVEDTKSVAYGSLWRTPFGYIHQN